MNTKEFDDEQCDYTNQQQNSPLLILVERDADLGSLLLHPWHYGALIHDIYHIENNKISFKESDSNVSRTYDLDCSTEESYWVEKMNIPYPDVAEDINDRF